MKASPVFQAYYQFIMFMLQVNPLPAGAAYVRVFSFY